MKDMDQKRLKNQQIKLILQMKKLSKYFMKIQKKRKMKKNQIYQKLTKIAINQNSKQKETQKT